MDTETERRIATLYHFQETMSLSYTDSLKAFKVLEKYDEDNTMYGISLSFLIMAQQSYLELKRIYWEKDVVHPEIDGYFTAFDHYAFQLKQVIVDKDENLSWLVSARDKLVESWKSCDEFLKNWINNNISQRS
ncbi:hypothetical protein ACTHPF_27035 [Paenibacillus sp. SAF-054]|uniref:hypothetical protein n=1 Tax=unclassified Paenibacillus TaxID=185978 RepID=UPI003F7F9817